jgi:hypothetical protein
LVRTARSVQVLLPDAIDTCVGLPRLTPLGQTAPWVLGAFELHGELVPVISIDVWVGDTEPIAAPTDLVLVMRSGGFPVGVHASQPLCIEMLPPQRVAHARRRAIDLGQLRLTAAAPGDDTDDEARLARFERRLTKQALRRLEQRASHYGGFAGASAPAPTAAPARH